MSNTAASVDQGPKEVSTLEAKAAELDKVAEKFSKALSEENTPFTSALILSRGITALRELLDDRIMNEIMKLADTPLGFMTDKKTKGGYRPEEVKDAIIEAALRGFRVAGNEFNIIASRFYAAQAGLARKVREYPGLTDFNESFSVPKTATNGATVTIKASWKKDGIPDELTRDIGVKGDQYAGVDSYIGKARRKLYAAVLLQLQGISTPEGEVDDEPKQANATEVKKPEFNGTQNGHAAAKPDAQDKTQDLVAEVLNRLGKTPVDLFLEIMVNNRLVMKGMKLHEIPPNALQQALDDWETVETQLAELEAPAAK